MTALRRRLSCTLAGWAVRVDPDPPIKFMTRRLSVDIEGQYANLAHAITDVVNGQIGGLGFGRDNPGPRPIRPSPMQGETGR